MNRRTFIKNGGLLGASALLAAQGCAMRKDDRDFGMGYQLFSVREDMERDPLGTLRALKGMGYIHFEVYGFDAERNTIYGLQPKELRKGLDDLGLAATSGHYGFHAFLDAPREALDRYVDQCLAAAHALGSPYITWPWMAPEQRTLANFERLPAILNRIGERAAAAGIGFAYHNHDFEFTEYDGRTGFDIILRETDPDLVKLQIDMYWVMHSAQKSPKELIAEQAGRYVMWHIKDMHKVSRDYTELGNGLIDYLEVMPDEELSGLKFFYLEQGGNYTHNAMRSAADSAAYFNENLRHLIS